MQSNICAAAATAALLLAVAVAVCSAQCPAVDWTMRGDSCYKWFSSPNYWHSAEQVCRSHDAHLVSIGSESENRLVGRLSQCKEAWIGRYGTDLKRLADPTTYAWTDGSSGEFERHNFTQLIPLHKSLIRIGAGDEWWFNSFYHDRHPFVCEQKVSTGISARCPSGWSLFQNHCYLMPELELDFSGATLHCQRASSQLASVLTESELRYISQVIFGIASCQNGFDTVWLDLSKWSDLSGNLQGFQSWQTEHPNTDGGAVSCVILNGDWLQTEPCEARHRFVCKSRVAVV